MTEIMREMHCGPICIGKPKISLSRAFANQVVGICEVADQVWLVSFLNYDLGFFDQDEARVEPASNPCIVTPEKL